MLRKTGFAFVSLLLFSSPLVVSAQTLEQMQLQVQALLAQIAAMQGQQSQSGGSTAGGVSDDVPTGVRPQSCPDLSVTMQRGSRDAATGGQVSALQIFLANMYGLNDDDVVSGYFGAMTEKYVKQFQQKQGLPVYGIAGSLTRATIARLCAGVISPPPTSSGQVAVDALFAISGTHSRNQNGLPIFKFDQIIPLKGYVTNLSANTQLSYEIQRVINGSWGTFSKFSYVNHATLWNTRQSTWTYNSLTILSVNEQNPKSEVYRVRAYIQQCPTQGCDQNPDFPGYGPTPILAVSEWKEFWLDVGGSGSPITVTAPNGGEQWEVGKLNTVTWSPYGYSPDTNPANQVSVYLERLDGTRVGKIMDTGKASLHTYLNINDYQTWAQPGQYYVRVVNNVTGAQDRSDAPFTIMARSVDLKINGSDGPVTVTDNQAINLSWVNRNYTFPIGCTLSGVRRISGGAMESISVTANSSGTYYAYAPVMGGYTSVGLSCVDGAKGLTHTDYASVVSGGTTNVPASTRITSPNGGESIDPTSNQWNIKTVISGVQMFSLGLYKNDQWHAWLFKDVSTAGRPTSNFEWIHGHSAPMNISGINATGDNGGAIWKMYVTGLKSDGTGYVDDKSDAPFSFSGATTQALSCTLISDKTQYAFGGNIVFSWTSTNATYATFLPDTSGKDNLKVPGDKLPTHGSQPIAASVYGNPYVTLAVYNASGQKATCTKTVPVSEPTAITPNPSTPNPDPLIVLKSAPTPTVITSGGISTIEFKMNVDITNPGDDDMYIPKTAVVTSPGGSPPAGAIFQIVDDAGSYATSNVSGTFSRLSGGTDVENNKIRVAGGQTATLGLVATYKPTNTRPHHLQLALIGWSFNSSAAAPESLVTVLNFRTPPIALPATPTATVTSLYSLSVNNATNAKSDFCYSDWGTINVTIAPDAKSPLVLALDSYEPVKWNIINASGKKINKIITTGYHAQMVTGAVSGIPVEHHSMYQIGKAGKLTYDSNDFFYKAGATMPSRLYDWPTDPSCKATSGTIPLASRLYFTPQSDYALGAGSATSAEYKSMLQKLKTWSGGLTPTASRADGSVGTFTIGATKIVLAEESLASGTSEANVASAAAAYEQLIEVLKNIVSLLGQ